MRGSLEASDLLTDLVAGSTPLCDARGRALGHVHQGIKHSAENLHAETAGAIAAAMQRCAARGPPARRLEGSPLSRARAAQVARVQPCAVRALARRRRRRAPPRPHQEQRAPRLGAPTPAPAPAPRTRTRPPPPARPRAADVGARCWRSPPYCCPYPCPYCTLPLLTPAAGAAGVGGDVRVAAGDERRPRPLRRKRGRACPRWASGWPSRTALPACGGAGRPAAGPPRAGLQG